MTAWAPLLDGRPARLSLGPVQPRRTLEQNAMLHALIGQLAAHLGYTPQELKEVLKHRCGPEHTVNLAGRPVTMPRPTSSYTKAEASDMIEHVYRIAAEVGCILLDKEQTT